MFKNRRSAGLVALATLLGGAAAMAFMLGTGGAADLTRASAASARPGNLAGAFLSGRHAQATADAHRAVNYMDRVLELDPQNKRALQETYFLAAQAGDFEAAVPAARKSLEAVPRNLLMAPVIVAADHIKKGEYDKAWALVDKIPAQSAAGFALPLLRAWSTAPLQPSDKALAELAGLKNFQDSAGIILVMSGQLEEFYGHGAQALAHYDAIAAKADSEHLTNILMTAEGYDRLGKAAQAKALLTKFMAAHPGATAPIVDAYTEVLGHGAFAKITPVTGMANALYLASEMLLSKESNEFGAQVAITFAQTALYLNPEINSARRFIAAALAARGRVDEANAMLAMIKPGAPGYLEAQMQTSENLVREKKTAEATAILKTILKSRPTWVEAHLALGDMSRQEKKYAEAVASYDAAIKLTPDSQSNSWSLYFTRGIAQERGKNWDAAEKDFRKALQLKPDEPNVLNYLGYSYLERGTNVKEGRKLIEQAFAKYPDNGAIIDSMGWALYVNGEFEQAVTQLEKAIESEPADPTINDHLGDAYWKVGRRNEARFQWQRALGLDPEDSLRSVLSNKIENGLPQK